MPVPGSPIRKTNRSRDRIKGQNYDIQTDRVMEYLQCKACGCFSMVPMEVELPGDEIELLEDAEKESRFYTCQVCGDNWLSIKQGRDQGTCEVTFIHQMGIQPVLKRVAHMDTEVVVNENTVDHWDYFVGDEETDEQSWHARLKERRELLRSICCN